MADTNLDVIAIGDAVIDVIAPCDDEFLVERGLTKGAMRLVDEAEAEALYAAMAPGRETSGGSAANTMAGIAALGGRAAFIGQVADDQLGAIFAHDMRALGVRFETPAIPPPPASGRVLILVSPDAQRTMSSCPGASYCLTPAALDPDLIASAWVTFLEGYVWGAEGPRQAMLDAARIARSAGRSVAFTLSESLQIGNRREGVMQMIDDRLVDLLFGNEDEVRHLTGCNTIDQCVAALSRKVKTLVITRGARGAVGVEAGSHVEIPAVPPARLVDTTGAGDQFAAGFLFARCRNLDLQASLHAGALAAAAVIAHYGARPEAPPRKAVNQ